MIKKLFLLLLITMSIQTKVQAAWLTVLVAYCTPKVLASGVGFIAAAIGIKWFRTPDTKQPTLEQLNLRTLRKTDNTKDVIKLDDVRTLLAQPTIKRTNFQHKDEAQVYEIMRNIVLNDHDNNVTIVVTGFLYELAYIKCASGARYGYWLLKGNMADSPCVTYDNVNDTRAGYSFGGKQDIVNLDRIIREACKQNPKIRISLAGCCKGATTILNYLAHKAGEDSENLLQNVTSVVIESTPLSLDHIIRKQPLYCISHYFFRFVFPNYNYQAPTVLDAQKFPNVPMLIGGLKDDVTAPHEDIDKIQAKLHGLGVQTVERYVREKTEKAIKHGRLYKDVAFQKAAHDFLKKHTA